jgi:hypothetical protein
MPQNDAKIPTPYVSPQTRLVYNIPSPPLHHLLFDCCVFYSIGNRLRPKAWAPTLSLFRDGFAFRRPKQPPQHKLNQISMPGIAYNVAST